MYAYEFHFQFGPHRNSGGRMGLHLAPGSAQNTVVAGLAGRLARPELISHLGCNEASGDLIETGREPGG